MTVKEKISALVDANPGLIGFRGELTYIFCSVIPENYDLTDMTVLDIMNILPDEHLEYIYRTLERSYT